MQSKPTSSHKIPEKTPSLPPLSAIILAGGEGRRMGGQDKGLVHYHNKPLIQWVKDALPDHVKQTIISCNRNTPDYAHYGQTVQDAPSDTTYQGALAGIIAGLHICQHDWVIIMPCDMIFYPTAFATQAWTALSMQLNTNHAKTPSKIAVAHDGTRRQNLCLLLHKDEIIGVQDAFKTSHAVRHWLDTRQALNIYWQDAQAFMNLNDMQQIDTLEPLINE